MKNKITLGLLVFFIGVLLTACGSKKSTNSSPTNSPAKNEQYVDSSKYGKCNQSQQGSNCTQVFPGTFSVSNQALFADVFGVANQPGGHHGGISVPTDIFDGSQWRQTFNGIAQCGIGFYLTRWISKKTGTQAEFGCGIETQSNINTGGNFGGQTGNHNGGVQSSYPAELIVDNAEGSITLRIKTTSNGYNGEIIRFSQQQGDPAGEYYNYPQADIRIRVSARQVTLDVEDGTVGVFR